MIAAFAPAKPLELGCAAGAVLTCLERAGIAAYGVEISSMAIAKATESVRPRIHQGDLLALDLPRDHDVLFGLDIFEHLNPNKLDAYLARMAEVTSADAYLFCNIPAFGEDPIFGTVFPFYIDGWKRDAAAGRPFSALHVDDLGYPIHGHLAWADAAWWTRRFAGAPRVFRVREERVGEETRGRDSPNHVHGVDRTERLSGAAVPRPPPLENVHRERGLTDFPAVGREHIHVHVLQPARTEGVRQLR